MSSTQFADSILREMGTKWTFASIADERNKATGYYAEVESRRPNASSQNDHERINRADIWIRHHGMVLSRAHTALSNANRLVADILPLQELYNKALALAEQDENIPALAKLDVEKLAIAFEHARTVEHDETGKASYGTTAEDAAIIARASSDDGSWIEYILRAAAGNPLAPFISFEKLPTPFTVYGRLQVAKENVRRAVERLDREFAAIPPFEAIFA